MTYQDFLKEIYSLCEKGKPRHALECIFDVLDDQMIENNVFFISCVFKEVELPRLAPTCILGLFSILFPHSDKPEINSLFRELYPRAFQELENQLQDKNRAEDLLKNVQGVIQK